MKMQDYRRKTEKPYKIPETVQELIPVCRISEDGIFELEEKPDGAKKLYDRAYLFEDANFATMDDYEREDFLKLYCGISDAAADSYTDFLSGREEQFLSAIGEYIYSIYDDLVQVTRIEVIEIVRNNEEECSCQIELFTEDGNSELFICSYNKKWDYYGVYSLYSVD
ncbi:MAG: hypothetical protein LUD12_10805 [Lachnospiraceae bacterium]|nr:hypothetical protein [Lachnospiraceae bacterium]